MTSSQPPPTDPRFEKLRAGEPLEFPAPPKDREETPDEKAARTIPASWLEILTEGHKRIVSVPVMISNASVEGPLNLQYAIFEGGFSAINTEFRETVDFSFAVFHRSATFDHSRFPMPALFRGAHAQADFEIKGASFAEEAIFQDLHVDEVLGAQGAVFGVVNFDRLDVGKSAFFRTDGQGHRVTFGGEARFLAARVAGDASFNGAEFKKKAAFDGLRVDGDASFCTDKRGNRVAFSGEARFIGAHISGSADFSGAEFKEIASFDSLEVGGGAFFRADARGNPVTFGGEARFHLAQVGGNAEFDGADFKADAFFDGVRFESLTFFRSDERDNHVTFRGCASFPSATFGAGTQFTGSEFMDAADFDDVHFKGAADFKSTRFTSNKRATFIGAHFEGGAYFDSARLGDLDFTAVVAERDTRFNSAEFLGPASFREASLHSLFFAEPDAEPREHRSFLPAREIRPQNATTWGGPIDFRGLTYERIYVHLPTLFERLTPFDRQPYSQLESSLRKIGDDQRAQQVYFERRRQERKHKFRSGRFLSWFLDWIYKLGANYGVAPLRLILFALALVFLGAFVFEQPGALEPSKKDASQPSADCSHGRFADGLAVSVHYFLPMDAPIGADCNPVSTRVLATAYVGGWSRQVLFWPSPSWYATIFLRVAGAILVGVGLAAVTGLLRRIAQ